MECCTRCGVNVDAGDICCPACGAAVNSVRSECSTSTAPAEKVEVPEVREVRAVPHKEPFLAKVLSVIWIGLGQIYAGKFLKGVFFMFTAVVLLIFAVAFPIPMIFVLILFWLWNICDAGRTAKNYNIFLHSYDKDLL